MRILLASSEVHPFSKTGGLADMIGALGKALAQAGHRVGIVTPLYQGIVERFPQIKRADLRFDLALGARQVAAELWTVEPAERLTVYFIHQPEFFYRPSLYQQDGAGYTDNAERFIFFSKCVVDLARRLGWQPEIVQANDWQAGFVPLLLQHRARTEGWGNAPASCLTIHNLAYQGTFPPAAYDLTNLPRVFFNLDGAEFFGSVNCLKAGIAFADVITTVSPRYAREITTEEFGCGLDGLLRKRQGKLFGILNGVDYDEWNTTHNPFLNHPYSAADLLGKSLNKLELQRELGLAVAPDVPLFGTIARLADQKGTDIELGALEEMLGADMQFALLGSGAASYERAYQKLARRFPAKAAVRIGFDQGLSHRIEAGCDFFIMPSRFEPCGLNQMYSLRYGTIPIVRTTGGLDDTVVDVSQGAARANGIKFSDYSAQALAKAMRKALVLYKNHDLLLRFRRNAMRADFSWARAVPGFIRGYKVARNSQEAGFAMNITNIVNR
jgi:starch synthase